MRLKLATNLGLLIGIALSSASLCFAQTVTVIVDCSAGEAIADALETEAERLRIDFAGTCIEDLVIERGNVLLRGTESSRASTIVGSVSIFKPLGVSAESRDGENVTLRNLTVRDSSATGIAVANVMALLDKVTTENHPSTGIIADSNATIALIRTTSQNNGGDGALIFSSSHAVMGGGVKFLGNGGNGITIATGATLFGQDTRSVGGSLETTTLTADGNGAGIVVFNGGSASFPASATVRARNNTTGVLVGTGSSLVVNGPLVVNDNSSFGLVVNTGGSLWHTGNLTARRNDTGLLVFGGQIELANATIRQSTSGDVSVGFGGLADFRGTSNVQTVSCDGTALLRGDVSCPEGSLRGSSIPTQVSERSPTVLDLLPALDFCRTLEEGGFGDWRLPAIEELTLFVGAPPDSEWLWTRTPAEGSSSEYKTLELESGRNSSSFIGTAQLARCVR